MTYRKKLIEVALPLDAINRESAREKQIRVGHPSMFHRWWARRPLSAVRAVLWSSLVDDPSAHPDRFPTEEAQEAERQRLFRILEELVKWENSNNEQVLEAARAEIVASCDGDLPNILDPFCGGGTIPLEAQRLGLPAYGGDLNPVAVLISKATVEIPPRFAGLPSVNPESRADSELKTWERVQGLAEDIRYYGQWMRDQAFERIGHLYPKVELPPDEGGGEANVIGWIWARTVQSPDPAWDGHVPLIGSWILRKAKQHKPVVWVEPVIDPDSQTITYQIREGGSPAEPTKVSSRADFRCVATGASIPNSAVREAGMRGEIGSVQIAVVAEGPDGRTYLPPQPQVEVPLDAAADLPGAMPPGGRFMAPPLYGMTDWRDLYTDRQLTALATYSDLLTEIRAVIDADVRIAVADSRMPESDPMAATPSYVDAILTYLAFGIDRMAEINNTLCPWEPGRQQIRNLYGRQAVPMQWSYGEANVFGNAAGDFRVSLGSLITALERLPALSRGEVVQRDAAVRVTEVPSPVVSTDPPYYDNISYADLSDFFYVWLRRNLQEIWPDELSTLATPKAEELIAHTERAGSKENAREFFESGMREVFAKVAEHQNPEFPATVFYAFKQEETDAVGTASTGWETFVEGLVSSGFQVVSTWPMRTELTVALKRNISALASSIVLAIRPRSADATLATRSEYVAELRSELPAAVRLLQRESIAPVDMAQSAIGPGMAVFSRYSKVIDADGSPMSVRQALVSINEVLQEILSEEETEFDGDTRWALTWFDQFGLNPGPYGDAETLSKAKNTSVKGVTQAGIAKQLDGKVRLLDRDELGETWDPAADARLTVWEVTQHLIARLAESESAAGDLLRRVGGGLGERARQLAYLLYQVADRRGWADEAVAYNSLVQAWPELSKLAGRSEAPVQQTLEE